MTALEDLFAIRRQAVEKLAQIEDIARNLAAERRNLAQLIETYDAKWFTNFQAELAVSQLTWCTVCRGPFGEPPQMLAEAKTELLLIEGREEYSHGYGNAYYGFRDFSVLHRACAACAATAKDRHGTRGEYRSQAKDQSIFYAFRVEKREDGFYVRRFGNWQKLNGEKYKLPDPPESIIAHLAQEWNLPPRLGIDREGAPAAVRVPAAF